MLCKPCLVSLALLPVLDVWATKGLRGSSPDSQTDSDQTESQSSSRSAANKDVLYPPSFYSTSDGSDEAPSPHGTVRSSSFSVGLDEQHGRRGLDAQLAAQGELFAEQQEMLDAQQQSITALKSRLELFAEQQEMLDAQQQSITALKSRLELFAEQQEMLDGQQQSITALKSRLELFAEQQEMLDAQQQRITALESRLEKQLESRLVQEAALDSRLERQEAALESRLAKLEAATAAQQTQESATAAQQTRMRQEFNEMRQDFEARQSGLEKSAADSTTKQNGALSEVMARIEDAASNKVLDLAEKRAKAERNSTWVSGKIGQASRLALEDTGTGFKTRAKRTLAKTLRFVGIVSEESVFATEHEKRAEVHFQNFKNAKHKAGRAAQPDANASQIQTYAQPAQAELLGSAQAIGEALAYALMTGMRKELEDEEEEGIRGRTVKRNTAGLGRTVRSGLATVATAATTAAAAAVVTHLVADKVKQKERESGVEPTGEVAEAQTEGLKDAVLSGFKWLIGASSE